MRMQVDRTVILLVAVGFQSCWQPVAVADIPGTYEATDGYYQQHRVVLEKGGGATETIVFADGQVVTSQGRWTVEPTDGTAKTVRLKGVVAYGGEALRPDKSNLDQLLHDADLSVESDWGRVRLCEESCELTYGGTGGKLLAIAFNKE